MALGKWYRITGACGVGEVARSGQWAYNAHFTGGQTEFVLESWAEMCDEQEGWYLQPDINTQAWFPITQANKQSHTVTISGDHTNLGTQGTRFRIYAPPGVQTKVPYAGLLPRFAEAASSRYLYRGYRYESPAAGRWDSTSQSVAARQGGSNFTGQHYTLFRHYDPSLMRFTSLDPLASSSNLFAYCENNPHSSYDPDGLESEAGSGWFVDFSFRGYLSRLPATLEGAGVAMWDMYDLATTPHSWVYGQITGKNVRASELVGLNRQGLACLNEQRGTTWNYNAGGTVTKATAVTVAAIATGGYAASLTPGMLAGMASYGAATSVTAASLGWGATAVAGMVGGFVGGAVGGGLSAALNGGGWRDVVGSAGAGGVLGGALGFAFEAVGGLWQYARGSSNVIRSAVEQPMGGRGVVLRDGQGATEAELLASVGGPSGGTRAGQAAVRQRLLDATPRGEPFRCWRCGQPSTNPADMHLGHRNVPTSLKGNLDPANVCLEGAACNLSSGNRGGPTPGMSCAERGSCGAPYLRRRGLK